MLNASKNTMRKRRTCTTQRNNKSHHKQHTKHVKHVYATGTQDITMQCLMHATCFTLPMFNTSLICHVGLRQNCLKPDVLIRNITIIAPSNICVIGLWASPHPMSSYSHGRWGFTWSYLSNSLGCWHHRDDRPMVCDIVMVTKNI